jgi:predicted RNA-binding protein YlqC (UPF0109 family)
MVKTMVSSLVDNPDQVEITSSMADGILLIEITVGSEDISRVIGRRGRIIRSIRTLTRSAASISGYDRVDIEITG